MGSEEILEDVSLRVILKDWGSKWQCLPFCWSWTGAWKRGDIRKRGHWFWHGGLRHLMHFSTWDSERFQAQPVCFFFFRDKKEYLLDIPLTCTFLPWLLDSLDMPRYSSESKKKQHPGWCLEFTMVLTNGHL